MALGGALGPGPTLPPESRSAGISKCLTSVLDHFVLEGVVLDSHSPILPRRRTRRTATGPPRARARWKSQRFTPYLQGGEP
jgi:hypothetical protein